LLAVLVLAAAGGVVLASGRLRTDNREALPDEPPAGRDSAAVAVTAEPVAYRPVQRSVEATGTMYGFEEVTLTAKVEGRVRVVHRDVGDRVRPGEAIVEIEATDYELAVRQDEGALRVELAKLGLDQPPDAGFDLTKVPAVVQAQVRVDNAKAKMDRAVKARASGVASVDEIDTATGDFRAAEAEYANQVLLARAALATAQLKQAALAISKTKLAETKVLVPTPTRPVPGADDGVTYAVTARGVSEGTMIRAGTEVCKLVIDRTLKLRVPVPERFSPEVRVGQAVSVTTAASPRPVSGTVARINPAVEPSTRTFEVEVQVPNPTGDIKPGSFAKAAILTRVDAEAVTVPVTAPYSFAGTTRVFVIADGKAKDVPVTLGAQTTEWVEVVSPRLPAGVYVVTSGQAILADGTPLTLREARGK
jgi:RND family efflux transporter MFP subunit